MTQAYGRILAVTVATQRFDETVEAYEGTLGFVRDELGDVSRELAAHWGAAALEGSRSALLLPASGRPVWLRVVELPGSAPETRPFRHWGWVAHELCVADVDAVCRSLEDSPFEIYGRPAHLELGTAFRPMQAIGPAGEGVFLTQCSADSESYDLPRAASAVDQAFIAVLAAGDLAETAEFYERECDLTAHPEFSLPYKTINRSFSLPEDTQHRVRLLQAGRHVVIEADAYPEGATPAPCGEGLLPAGIALMTFVVPAAVAETWPDTGPLADKVYDGRLARCLVGPSGERIELVMSES